MAAHALAPVASPVQSGPAVSPFGLRIVVGLLGVLLAVLVSGAPGRVVVVVRHVSSPSLKRQRVHQVQRPTRPSPGGPGRGLGGPEVDRS